MEGVFGDDTQVRDNDPSQLFIAKKQSTTSNSSATETRTPDLLGGLPVANANGDFADFNPRAGEAGSANGDFGDFSNFHEAPKVKARSVANCQS